MCPLVARTHPSPKVIGTMKGVQGETARKKKPPGCPDGCTIGSLDKMLVLSVRIHGARNVRPR